MLIGFHGKMGRGKDQACQFILDEIPNSRREAFADRLKISAARALGFKGTTEECIAFCNTIKQEGVYIEVWSSANLDGDIAFLTGRQFLQWYGTEAHREVFDQDFWIKAAIGDYDQREILVVTDVRFANEAKAIRALGGKVVHIVRPALDEAEAGREVHASEQILPPELIDYTIMNDGTLDDLRDKVMSCVSDLHTAAILR